MILNTSEGEFRAHFRHEKTEAGWRTECSVHVAPCLTASRPCGSESLGIGVAKCSPRDAFCRATGRKVAFGRAIAPLPRHVRRELWDAYFNGSKPGAVASKRKPEPPILPPVEIQLAREKQRDRETTAEHAQEGLARAEVGRWSPLGAA